MSKIPVAGRVDKLKFAALAKYLDTRGVRIRNRSHAIGVIVDLLFQVLLDNDAITPLGKEAEADIILAAIGPMGEALNSLAREMSVNPTPTNLPTTEQMRASIQRYIKQGKEDD